MNSLRGLQRDFQDCLLAGDESIRDQVIGTERVSADVRLGIYVDAYRLRLLDVLATDYPGVEALLGSDESFAQMGSAYIAAHPSPYFNVRWYGDRMAEFLATAMPYRDCPVLAEMAAFEWAMALAFDAADALGVSIEQVASLPPEAWAGMVCRMHPSVQRLDFRWNVPAIWKAVDAKAEPETPRGAISLFHGSFGVGS